MSFLKKINLNVLLNYAISASNFLFFVFIPDKIAFEVLTLYLFITLFFNAFAIYFFSQRQNLTVQLLFILIPFALFIKIIPFYLYGVYIIVFDYLISLETGRKNANFFKIVYIFSSLLFIFSFENTVYTRVLIITLYMFLVVIDLKKNKITLNKLKLNNPFNHIVITHILYFAPLIIISEFFYEKIWYLSGQIILFMILRFIDSQIKGFVSATKFKFLYYLAPSLICLYLILLYLFLPSYQSLSIIIISSLILIIYSFKILKKNEVGS